MSRCLRRWSVATLLFVALLSAGSLVGPAAGAPDTPPTDTVTGTPMGTSGTFPTEAVAVGLALAGIVLAGAGAVALRRRGERNDAGTDGSENR
jgi:hypothetical protein